MTKKTPAQRLKDHKRFMKVMLWIALGILVATWGWYFVYFPLGVSGDQQVWGVFGDFVGGVLNPFFALLALFALLYTIVLQVEEMQDMRAEFTKTVEAAKHQTFEATFFQMLRLHNHNVERIRWQYLERDIQKVKTKYINGREALAQYHESFEQTLMEGMTVSDAEPANEQYIEFVRQQFARFFKLHSPQLAPYFLTILEIVSLVDDYNPNYAYKYARLFATQFHESELMLIAYYCMGTEQFSKVLTRRVNECSLLETLPDSEVKRLLELDYFAAMAFSLPPQHQ